VRRPSPQPRTGPGHPQAGDLPRDPRPLPPELAALVQGPRRGPAELAARGFRDRVRRREDHLLRRHVGKDGPGRFDDSPAQLLPCRRVAQAGLGDHDEPFGAVAGIGAGDRGHATAPHPLHHADDPLQLLRVDVAAGPDDHVLDPARDVDLAARDVGAVPALQPNTVEERPRLLGGAEISRRRGRPFELQPALVTVGQLAPGVVHVPDLVPRDGVAAGDEFQRVRRVGGCRCGDAPCLQGVAVDPVHHRPAHRRGERERDGVLGQAVDWRHGFGPETVAREALREAGYGAGARRLGPVQEPAERAEVETLDISVADGFHA
jgi:hypothetical protein